ncbi:MAG: hypothetical protein AAFV46_08120 [Cyanobacteria bacterium J06635_11]
MASTSVLDSIKLKKACTNCGGHRLSTHNNLKIDDAMYYQCLDCGFEFFEDEAEQEFSKQKAKKNKEGNQSLTIGYVLIFAMLTVILAINITRREERSRNLIEPNENAELLIQQQPWIR